MRVLRSFHAFIAAHGPLVLAALSLSVARGQIPVNIEYGYHTGANATIATSYQVDYYVLNGWMKPQPQSGDVLVVTFSSVNNGGPFYTRLHKLDVWDGTTRIGTIQGFGRLNVTLPRTGAYTITVQAQNSLSTGWYAFQVNRINNPVDADRMAFDWHLKGATPQGIAGPAAFSLYTLRAEANSSALLRFTCVDNGGPFYTCLHYAELLDATGKQVVVVNGCNAAGAAISFQATGIYTLLVAAQNYEDTGWFDALFGCQQVLTQVPCDTVPYSGNYGNGWPGTNNTVPTLSASAPPKLGTMSGINIGNSYGKSTTAFVLMGTGSDNWQYPATYGGATLLVAQPVLLPPVVLQPGGGSLPIPIPTGLPLGIGVAFQALVDDPNASPAPLAFSRGLLLLIGR